MRRGDIWTVAGGKEYERKPRPVVIVQDDSFDDTDSMTIRAFTTDETDAPLLRLPTTTTPHPCFSISAGTARADMVFIGGSVAIQCAGGLRGR